MCGIVGFAATDEARFGQASSRTASALECLRHRGPDACGECRDGKVWLGHVRLSILDLSPKAAQPMESRDRQLVICYNGEVYNFQELRTELGLTGLRSHSDTEVVLEGFRRIGPAVFKQLNGVFALALYDRSAQRLWLVRDRLGVKPLYYGLDEEGLAFSSELKGIHAIRGSAPACDISCLHEWLYYGAVLGGRTLHKGLRQVPPGQALELDLRTFRARSHTYWSLDDAVATPVAPGTSDEELVSETRRLLDLAVKRQLVSDVPVGVFLSGGVDSSAITAFASRHYSGRLTTYAAGFDDRNGVDERPKARAVSAHFGTDHHEFTIGAGDVADLIERMVHHHDQPFSDAANIPVYLMASAISGQTKVVLQGDGGDEVFGGYRRYTTLRYYRLLHAAARLGRWIPRLLPARSGRQRVQRYADAFAAADLGTTVARLLTLEEVGFQPASAFTADLRRAIERSDPFERYREVERRFADADICNRMSLVDLSVELPDVFLEKVDRASMAASLEVRVPFLDNDLVEFVARLPGRRKMPGGRKKWLLKRALDGIVPSEVLDGPKTGFSVPFAYWLRTSLRPFFEDHLTRFNRRQPGVLDTATVRGWYEDTREGRTDRSYMLWKMLNFLVWCNAHCVRVAE